MNPSTFLRTAATAIFLGGGAVAGCTSGTTSDLPGSELATNDAARDAGGSRDGTSPQTPQGLRASCGNGVREIGEDCDLGAQATASTYCSQRCKTRDLLAPAVSVADGGSFARSLGAGRHPIASTANGYAIAAIESGALVVLVFDAKGLAAGKITLDAASSPDADPSIAALPSGKYVVVWTDRAIDERDVAIVVVDPSSLSVVGQVSHANAVTNASQFDADVVVVNGQAIVAWTDTSDAGRGPDVRYRVFDAATLAPATTTDQTLAATAAVEGSVALTVVGSTQWAAAWRDGQSDGERLQARLGSTQWTVGPFVAGAAGDRPALVALDATHLLAVYGEGTDPGDSGVANTSNLRAVVLDAATPSNIAPRWLSSGSNARDQPAAAMVGATPYVAWRTAAVPGDVNGEELWLQPLAWNGTTLDTSAPAMTLVRWPLLHSAGDQRSPALTGATFAGGALVGAWIDLGKTFGASEGQGDLAFEIAPTPILRGAGTPDDPSCPSGQRYCDSACTSTSLDVTNCGNCGASCDAPPGATASCVAGACVVACSTGFHNCGASCVSSSSLATCGASCVACPAPPANGTSTCDGTSCGFACNAGYANCGGGTCTNLGTDLANCGMCGFACGPVAHGTRACVAGTCAVNCSAGYHACGNSCADNASVNSCGGSCTPCAAPPNGTATCAAGQCGFACNAGFAACNGQCLDANDPVLNSCLVTDAIGVFVSASLGSAQGDGTRARPLSTLAAGIAAAGAAGKRVYACAETYAESLTLANGVSMLGSFRCAGGVWNLGTAHATVNAPSSPAIVANGIALPTRFDGFDVVAPNASAPSTSSIGLLAINAPALTIANAKIHAGVGSNGADGVAGATLTQLGTINASGPAGGSSRCVLNGVDVDASLNGGAGGSAGRAGFTHKVCEPPDPDCLHCKPVCHIETIDPTNGNNGGGATPGHGGALGGAAPTAGGDGAVGVFGASASIFVMGSFAMNTPFYAASIGAIGQVGMSGVPGSGGGGAAGDVTRVGGGGGGCPGLGGAGGSAGGASIAVLAFGSPIALVSVVLESSAGGGGGKGAFGGPGTPGGTGAARGGAGGGGGAGGSGAGGPSMGIAYTGGVPTRAGGSIGVGAGGAGVAAQTSGTVTIPASAGGIAIAVYAF